jgi:hypothetical protein
VLGGSGIRGCVTGNGFSLSHSGSAESLCKDAGDRDALRHKPTERRTAQDVLAGSMPECRQWITLTLHGAHI